MQNGRCLFGLIEQDRPFVPGKAFPGLKAIGNALIKAVNKKRGH